MSFSDSDDLRKNRDQIKKIFFYRICGMGMGASATLLASCGFEVSGGDVQFYPPMGDYLKSQNLELYNLEDVDEELLKKFDLIVVGNSVSGNSDAAKVIEASGVRYTSFPCVLGEYVLRDRQVIGVAGTHGKTTTTYYLTQILEGLGEDVGYFVGGVIDGRPPARLGTSRYFVIESDEYDSSYFQKFSKFRQYNIDHLILNALEFDHADIFETVEDIAYQFRQILNQINSFYFCQAYAPAEKLGQEFEKEQSKSPLGYGPKSSFGPFIESSDEAGTDITICPSGEKQSEGIKLRTSVLGEQNIQNIGACLRFILNEGFEIDAVKKSLLEIDNVKRRQELRGFYKGAAIIDDFAHHPTSYELTIGALKTRFPNRKAIIVIEPVTSTARSSAFQDRFVPALSQADAVLVVDPGIPTNALGFENLDYQKLVGDLNAADVPAILIKELSGLEAQIDKYAQADSFIAFFSNRTVLGLWESEFVSRIKLED